VRTGGGGAATVVGDVIMRGTAAIAPGEIVAIVVVER
jgi:hypothetical protein